MKKLLLALVVAFTFGSAVAKTNTLTNLNVSEEGASMLYKADTSSLINLGVGTSEGWEGCVIHGNCMTCWGRTFCVEK